MSKSVSVVIPIYSNVLSLFEEISLVQCFKIFENYEIQFVLPNKMKDGVIHNKYKNKAVFIFLSSKWFSSIKEYNRMMLSSWFYELFKKLDYILIYQLDAFVFKDDLKFWIDKDYSFIGSPIFEKKAMNSKTIEFIGVGNGGFSLRNVNDFIRVLHSYKKRKGLIECIKYYKSAGNKFFLIYGLKSFLKGKTYRKIYKNEFKNEDIIFMEAGSRFKHFKIPSLEVAASFSFEREPKSLFSLNNHELPFGCHAWWKYDLDFFKKFIELHGYNLTKVR